MLFGITAWGIPAIMAVVCGDIVGPLMAPAAYGFLTAFHGFGQAAGPYVAGRLADSLPTFTASYLMAAGVAFLGAIGMLLLRWAPGGRDRPTAAPACETPAASTQPRRDDAAARGVRNGRPHAAPAAARPVRRSLYP